MAVRRFAAGLLCAFLLLPAGCGQAQETKDQQPKGEQEPVTFRCRFVNDVLHIRKRIKNVFR